MSALRIRATVCLIQHIRKAKIEYVHKKALWIDFHKAFFVTVQTIFESVAFLSACPVLFCRCGADRKHGISKTEYDVQKHINKIHFFIETHKKVCYNGAILYKGSVRI